MILTAALTLRSIWALLKPLSHFFFKATTGPKAYRDSKHVWITGKCAWNYAQYSTWINDYEVIKTWLPRGQNCIVSDFTERIQEGGQIKGKTWIKEWRTVSNADASVHQGSLVWWVWKTDGLHWPPAKCRLHILGVRLLMTLWSSRNTWALKRSVKKVWVLAPSGVRVKHGDVGKRRSDTILADGEVSGEAAQTAMHFRESSKTP